MKNKKVIVWLEALLKYNTTVVSSGGPSDPERVWGIRRFCWVQFCFVGCCWWWFCVFGSFVLLPHLNHWLHLCLRKAARELRKKRGKQTKIPFNSKLYFRVLRPFCGVEIIPETSGKWFRLPDKVLKYIFRVIFGE